MNAWSKLLKNNPSAPCPISDIASAYSVEFLKKTENQKASYKPSIDILGGTSCLPMPVIQALLDLPRIPDHLYRYTRYHLEATVEFLKQYDEKLGIEVLNHADVQAAINIISSELPASDTSSFSFDRNASNDDTDDNASEAITLDSLWDMFDELERKGLGDKTEEGAALKTLIAEYIDQNDLDVAVRRNKTTLSLLEEIEALYKETGEKPNVESEETETEDEDNDNEEPEVAPIVEPEPIDEPEDEEPAQPTRRTARPARRR